MIVGITMRQMRTDYGEVRDALAHDWFDRLLPFGVAVLQIPNALKDPVAYAQRFGVQRLLLTGGDGLGPLPREGGQPMPTKRDHTEAALLDWALRADLPVLAVCRGLQMTNVHLGGGVTRQLADAVPQEQHRNTFHDVTLDTGAVMVVNSFHDEGVLEHQIAADLKVFARTAQGVVEGVRHRSKPLTAVQWHPERPSVIPEYDDALLAAWLEGA